MRALHGGETRAALAAALNEAHAHAGCPWCTFQSITVPNPLGGMGAYGSWNVGNWVTDVQQRYHSLGV